MDDLDPKKHIQTYPNVASEQRERHAGKGGRWRSWTGKGQVNKLMNHELTLVHDVIVNLKG